MKKNLAFILILAFTVACSNEQTESTAPEETPQVEIEALENSIEKVDEAVQASEQEMKKNQDEIDALLNDI